jgi:hypothetical protein
MLGKDSPEILLVQHELARVDHPFRLVSAEALAVVRVELAVQSNEA